jgi:hypothetical protein
MRSYSRRKRWEAELLAAKVGEMLGDAFGRSSRQVGLASGGATTSGGKYRKVSADSLLMNMGVKL